MQNIEKHCWLSYKSQWSIAGCHSNPITIKYCWLSSQSPNLGAPINVWYKIPKIFQKSTSSKPQPNDRNPTIFQNGTPSKPQPNEINGQLSASNQGFLTNRVLQIRHLYLLLLVYFILRRSFFIYRYLWLGFKPENCLPGFLRHLLDILLFPKYYWTNSWRIKGYHNPKGRGEWSLTREAQAKNAQRKVEWVVEKKARYAQKRGK